jgi:hypothetical protein
MRSLTRERAREGVMGLFDRKKKDGAPEFDSYIEEVRVSGKPAAPKRVERGEEKELRAYTIDRAIVLMRQLPRENVELVVEVVKKTLESTNIKLATIIEDAARKQQYLEERRDLLKQEIADLESEIATRKREIITLEADHQETVDVKERFLLAERQAEERMARAKAPPAKTAASADAAAKGPTA